MKSTMSTRELFALFPDETTAREHLEKICWAESVTCPHCESDSIYTRKARAGFYDCRDCKAHFSVRTGTVFEKSHVKLHKWIYAIYLLITSRKGISSLQLSKEIGVTQKTAWFILHRLRLACGNDLERLTGIVAIDETHIGDKENNKHEHKKRHKGHGGVGKQAVLGMRERGGRTKTKPITNTSRAILQGEGGRAGKLGATVYADKHSSDDRLDVACSHEKVR